jgi:peptidoglycan-N-acetylglucosamine deacetylase
MFLLRRRRIALLAIWALGWSVSVAPPLAFVPSAWSQAPREESAVAWLRSAATAPRRTSYEGTKTVTIWTAQGRASQVRVYHEAPDRTRLEYLAAGDQPRRIVVITRTKQVEFIPSRNQVIERPAAQPDEAGLTRQILPRILASYTVAFAATEQVAGRPARLIDVRSQYPGRPRLRIWIDTATRLILRYERYGPDGALREASAFLSLRINPVLSPDLFVLTPPPGAQVVTRRPGRNLALDEIGQRVGFTPRLPGYLPAGYTLVRSRIMTIRGRRAATLAFSDGVSTLTLFESLGPEGSPPNGKRIRVGRVEGAVVRRGVVSLLHWNAGGISFTLVGDLRQEELVQVAASVPPGERSVDLPALLAQAGRWLAALGRMPAAEAEQKEQAPPGELGIPPVPASPYITNYTHPIGRGIRDEEEEIWGALRFAGLTPFVVKVTVASDGVSTLPDGRLARLAWIWFVYGMDWSGGADPVLQEVRESARALAQTAFSADPRVTQVLLTGYYHVSGRFDGNRTDVTFTARVYRDAFLNEPPDLEAAAALAQAGDVWYSPDLLAGALAEQARVHDPHLPLWTRRVGPALPGERIPEAGERFQGSLLDHLRETKYRLEGLLFGVDSHGRVWRGNPRRREIALTFDDGPSPLTTPLLLAILRWYGVPATFFIIGEHARAYPYLVAQMEGEGHEVGDHTFHHPNMSTVDPATVRDEIGAAAALIGGITGHSPRWFRPPGGDYSEEVVAETHREGMDVALWTDNSGDWAGPSAKIVVERVLARAEPGAIVLLHNGTLNTVQALPRIIVELRHRGYTLVTLSDLVRGDERK